MCENFNKNIIESIKMFKNKKFKNNEIIISITTDGYIYFQEYKIVRGKFCCTYLIYKNNKNIIRGPKNIICCSLIDSDKVVYFLKDEKKFHKPAYIFQIYN